MQTESKKTVPDLVSTLSERARRRIVDGGLGLERALNQVLDQAMESELAWIGTDTLEFRVVDNFCV